MDSAQYYGGLTQKEVKPSADSPLLMLGMDKVPPLITTAVLLDAKAHVGRGKPMGPGELVTSKHIEEMLRAQGLSRRGIRAGDIVYVHTGWGDYWKDPDTEKFYYTKAPGLSYDAARYLGERKVVAIGLDTPFIDPVPEGMPQGKSGPAAGTPPGLPFAVHHHMLSCTLVLPLREKGAAGSAIRPVAIGAKATAQKSAAGRPQK